MSTHIGLAQPDDLFSRIALIIEQAQSSVVRTVNVEMVKAYWLIGREIIEEEQAGGSRAEYGERLIVELSKRLTARYGSGFSATNLKYCRQFYLTYRDRVLRIGHALGDESSHDTKSHAVRGQFSPNLSWTHYRRLMRVDEQIFASRYKLYLPDEAELAAEIRREVEMLTEGKEN